MSDRETYAAMERLKKEADGLDALIEFVPKGLEWAIEQTFEMDYLNRKREIQEQRDKYRQKFTKGRERIESTYGTAVNRALNRRFDGDEPTIDLNRLNSDLDDAKKALDNLKKDLDTDYLKFREKRTLQELQEDIFDAREYARTKIQFDISKSEIIPEIEAFEERFEPYERRNKYMISSDQEYLSAQSKRVWRLLSDVAAELPLHVLPDNDAAWLGEEKSRFNGFADAIPQYNQHFVDDERSEYVDVLTSEHGKLNESQQKAVIRNDRRNLVDASAGTGKTLTLTHRYLYLLEKGVQPERIVAITYMGDAAEEMKSRIANEAGLRESQLNISTIHSFARNIAMEASPTGGSGQDIGDARSELVNLYFDAAVQQEKPEPNEFPHLYEKFNKSFHDFLHRDRQSNYIEEQKPYNKQKNEYIRDKLEKFVKKARTFELSPETIRSNLDSSNAVAYKFGEAGSYLVAAYEQIVERESAPTDFDDMVQTAREIVKENPEEFGRRYDHILVDEYQDVSESTLGFVDALVEANDETHLFCVGDDWQSIMGFTGSNVRYFTEFEDKYDDVTYTSLKVNYRCPPKVVEAGSELIKKSEAPQNSKKVEAHADPEDFEGQETMQLHLLEDLYQQRAAAYAANLVEEALDQDYDYDEIMILSRNDEKSGYMRDIRKELKKRNIPHMRPKWDYIPESFKNSFDQEIIYNSDGEAKFKDTDESPPLITIQSAHSSKGTEAPVVIFLHAVGNTPDGIPIEERTDELLDPAIDITSEHIPEERRLFYVALTRAEEVFHAITKPGSESQFVRDIEYYFTKIRSSVEICGECTFIKPPREKNHPYNITLDCGSFEAELVGWPNGTPKFSKGNKYKLKNPVVEDNGYGEQIRFDKSDVIECE